MVNLNIKCPNCGREGPKLTGAPSQERVLEMIHSWECECGWIFAEKSFEKETGEIEYVDKVVDKLPEDYIDIEDPDEEKTKIIQEAVRLTETITPNKKLSDFIAGGKK